MMTWDRMRKKLSSSHGSSSTSPIARLVPPVPLFISSFTIFHSLLSMQVSFFLTKITGVPFQKLSLLSQDTSLLSSSYHLNQRNVVLMIVTSFASDVMSIPFNFLFSVVVLCCGVCDSIYGDEKAVLITSRTFYSLIGAGKE